MSQHSGIDLASFILIQWQPDKNYQVHAWLNSIKHSKFNIKILTTLHYVLGLVYTENDLFTVQVFPHTDMGHSQNGVVNDVCEERQLFFRV